MASFSFNACQCDWRDIMTYQRKLKAFIWPKNYKIKRFIGAVLFKSKKSGMTNFNVDIYWG